MKHFSNIEVAPPPVTYDTMHSVTLSLSDWNDIQTYLFFYGENNRTSRERISGIISRMWDQTGPSLEVASAETAEDR